VQLWETQQGHCVKSGTARLQVVAAAILFSTGGAGIKAAAFSGVQVSALRSGIAAVVLMLFVRGQLTMSTPVLGVGLVYGATLTLFVLGTKLTSAANAIFLQSTYPLYVLLLSPFLLGERISRRDILYLAAVAAGLALCVIGSPAATTTAPNPTLGNVFAVLSGLVWAITLLGLRYVERNATGRSPAMSAVIAGNVFASLAALPFAWPMPNASPAEWGTIVYLGVFQIGLAYVCLTKAVGQLPALDVSLLLLLEPVLNPLWAWLVRSERPDTWTIAGGSIIIVVTALKTIYDAYGIRTDGAVV
jgi:drug/metabolite transporter (DMT)-like permease